MVGSGAGGAPGQGGEKGLTINNFIDPNLFGQYIASTPGQRQLVNVISDNKFAIRAALFS